MQSMYLVVLIMKIEDKLQNKVQKLILMVI